MNKRIAGLVAAVLTLTLILSACDAAGGDAFTVGMVTDIGGIDDKSFNALAWDGVQRAEDELGVEGSYLESNQQTDYATHLTQYINQNTDLIVTVGFLLADATQQFANDNPDTSFAIVDFAFDPPIDNVRGLTFSTDEAGFLAGYVAAAATQTGSVATFGGIKIPTVTVFMVGFESGVEYYNAENGTDVQVLGWDTDEGTGLFVGNFESTEDGRSAGEDFLNEGADVIMPVAGPVGLGTAQAVQASGDAWVIGVDADWTATAPEYEDIILTSVLKLIDNAVFDTIEAASSDDFQGFQGENYVGTLENEGVGLADVADGAVDQAVLDELETIRQGIIDGEIDTGWDAYLAAQGE